MSSCRSFVALSTLASPRHASPLRLISSTKIRLCYVSRVSPSFGLILAGRRHALRTMRPAPRRQRLSVTVRAAPPSRLTTTVKLQFAWDTVQQILVHCNRPGTRYGRLQGGRTRSRSRGRDETRMARIVPRAVHRVFPAHVPAPPPYSRSPVSQLRPQ